MTAMACPSATTSSIATSSDFNLPVAAPAAGKLKSLLVAIDDVVAEGQAIAVIET